MTSKPDGKEDSSALDAAWRTWAPAIATSAFLRTTARTNWSDIEHLDRYLLRAVRNEAHNLSRQRRRRWEGLEPPYEDMLGAPSYEVCPTCGFEFGNDDNPGTAPPVSFEQYRTEWIANGSPVFDEKLILFVDDTFELAGRPGVTVLPHVERNYEPGDYDVVLRYPDQTRCKSTANLSWASSVPGGFRLVCRLPMLSKDQVPLRTEVRLA